jgi:hypothetical protein
MDIHDKTSQLFKSFINDLIMVYPEYNDSLSKNYNELLDLLKIEINNEKLRTFLKIINKYSEKISNMDEDLFKFEDEILIDIKFKDLWKDDISEKNKETIWKYLQSFCLINININTSNKIEETIQNINDKKKIDKKIVKDLKNFKKIKDNSDADTENLKEIDESFDSINDMISNTMIGDLAKEITEDLNINEDNHDITSILNPEKMSELYKTINEKIQTKINSDGVNKDKLVSEAGDICNNMKTTPLFSNMMNNDNGPPDIGNMMGSLMGNFSTIMGGNGGNENGEIPDFSNIMSMMNNMTQQMGNNFEKSDIDNSKNIKLPKNKNKNNKKKHRKNNININKVDK